MKISYLLIYILLNCCDSHAKLKVEDIQRIVGGDETSVSKMGGFIVALKLKGFFICGGSYVAKLFVVTAAHCVHNDEQVIAHVTVQGGMTSLDENIESNKITHVVFPSTYNAKTKDMDVAVLKLQKPIKSPLARLIKLCSHKVLVGDLMRVSGWGITDIDNMQTMIHLRSVEVPAISKAECKSAYEYVFPLTSSMICAGKLGEKDACTYDSGGPLVHNNELCGIVSFGFGCADPKYPGVYTDIHAVKAFISRTIENLS